MRNKLAALLAALIWITLSPAHAFTAYWVGAERLDFDGSVGNVTWADTTSGDYTTGLSRSAIKVGVSSASITNTDYVSKVIPTSLTSFWFHTQLKTSSVAYNYLQTATQDIISFLDAGGVKRLTISCEGTNSSASCAAGNAFVNFVVTKITAAGARTTLFTFGGIPAASTTNIDVQVVGYGSSCSVYLFLNAVASGSFTGDCHTDSNTAIQGVQLAAFDPGTSEYAAYSQSFFADSNTTGLALSTLPANGNGANSAWAYTGGSAYASVNQNPGTDAVNVNSGTATQVTEFTSAGLPSGVSGVLTVALSCRCAVGSSGPQHIQPVVRISGTDYAGTAWAPSVSLLNYQAFYNTDPTSAPWTTSTVNAMQFGLKSGT